MLRQKATEVDAVDRPSCDSQVFTIAHVCRGYSQEYPSCVCSDYSFQFARPLPIQFLNERQLDSILDAELFGSNLMKFLLSTLCINKEIRMLKSFLDQGRLCLMSSVALGGFQMSGIRSVLKC